MSWVLITGASLGIGVLFGLPIRSLIFAALIAASGYLTNQGLQSAGAAPVEAAFAGAYLVAQSAELLARYLKVPAPVLSTPGMIPLVPGSIAYRATVHFVEGRQLQGMETALHAGLIAIGIASGLLLATSLSRRFLSGQVLAELDEE